MGSNQEAHDETADLLRRLTDQTSTLIRQEMELARVEMQAPAAPEPASRAGGGPTALFGLGATGAFVAGLILALATVVEAWVAAFGVAAVLALLAVVSAAASRARREPTFEQPVYQGPIGEDVGHEPVAPEPVAPQPVAEQETPEQDALTAVGECELGAEPDSEVIAVYAQSDARKEDFDG